MLTITPTVNGGGWYLLFLPVFCQWFVNTIVYRIWTVAMLACIICMCKVCTGGFTNLNHHINMPICIQILYVSDNVLKALGVSVF